MDSLPSILFWTQILLLVSSSILFIGCVFGLSMKRSDLAKASILAHQREREQRKVERFKNDALLEIDCALEGYTTSFCRLVNLSSSGACFSSHSSFRPGERIQGRLHASKDERLKISGDIVWMKRQTRSILYGLRFE